ncbi:MAG: ABC transporter permease [Coriobacteriia bacterium]
MFFERVRLLMAKEFLQLLRDRAMIPILFVMPVLQLVMFGYVVGADVRDIRTAVVDLDRSTASREAIGAFSGSGYFRIVASPSSEDGVRTLMDTNEAQVAVIVPAGYGRLVAQRRSGAIEVIVDGSDSKVAQVASGYSGAILADLGRRMRAAAGMGDAGPGIDARVRVLFNPSLRSVNTMVPGLISLILLLSATALMSQAVVKERERGTLEQLFVTPITRVQYLVGKIMPYVLVAIAQVTLVFTVGVLWFRVPFRGSLLVIAAGVLLFLFAGLGQGLLISTVSHTRQQAQQATMFIMIPSMVLSGFIFPLESMPKMIRPVTYLIPLRYILVILRATFMKGAGFVALWPQFAALAGFSLLIFAAALARFQKRLAD